MLYLKKQTPTLLEKKKRYFRREGRAQRPHTLLHTKIGGKKITFALMKNKTKTKIDTQERGPSIETSYTPLKKNRHSKKYRHSHCWKKKISDTQTHRHIPCGCRRAMQGPLAPVCVCVYVCVFVFVCVCLCVCVCVCVYV